MGVPAFGRLFLLLCPPTYCQELAVIAVLLAARLARKLRTDLRPHRVTRICYARGVEREGFVDRILKSDSEARTCSRPFRKE